MAAQVHDIGIRMHSGRVAGTAPAMPLAVLRLWRERRQTRQELARLLKVGSHLISDIGLDRARAEAEAEKPFWQG